MKYTIRVRETGNAAQSSVPLQFCLASLEAAADSGRAAAFWKLYQSLVKLPRFPRAFSQLILRRFYIKKILED
jgi:hypothetical protein